MRIDPLVQHYPIRIREVTFGVIMFISLLFYLFPRFLGESGKIATTFQEEIVLEIKDSSNYSFDESRILAIEEVEKRLKENFFTNSINRINFSLINLLNESI